MPKYEEIKSKYRVCRDNKFNDCKEFDSLEELIKWAKEEKNKEINVGDIVTIEKYGDMFDTLDVEYFKDLWENTVIDLNDIYKLMIHYDYGCNYGIGHNPNKEKDRIKWKVLFIHDERVFIERHDAHTPMIDNYKILCIKKSGLKKYEEV